MTGIKHGGYIGRNLDAWEARKHNLLNEAVIGPSSNSQASEKVRITTKHFVPWQDALIGEHLELRALLLAHKGKVFRNGIGLVEHTVLESPPG